LTNTLIHVDEAIARILRQIEPLSNEMVALNDAYERVLAQDVIADVSLPPFANSSMDGFAVRAADVKHASRDIPVRLDIVADIPAGMASDVMILPKQVARIMTGAPLPPGADAIIPVEDTDGQWDDSTTLPDHVSVYRSVKSGDFVRPAGEDVQSGQKVLTQGTVLRPQDLGILAALGRASVPVVRKPKVALLASGNEIVPVDAPLTPGKIRDVNSYTLSALLRAYGAEPIVLPVAPDTVEAIRQQFHTALQHQPDMVISSAGASVGAADFIHTVLQELGEVGFWKINLRPGKPLAFGKLQSAPFFGLPGNPVSVMVTFDVVVRPALLKMSGRPDDWYEVDATLSEGLRSDGRRSYIRVKLMNENGNWVASTTGTQSSGALMSMVLADGLLIVPEGVREVRAGQQLRVRLLRPEKLFHRI
jgi:molybdopterin molybdotransferase